MRLRFAPSPTGFVHVGNARTALFNFLHARRLGGTLVLRIEDTDVDRSKKEYEENLIKDLGWLGIQWDEGPDRGGDYAPYRQAERTDLYQQYARQLIDGGKAYYCFCSQEDYAGMSGYNGKCRALDIDESKQRVQKGEAAAIRFHMPAATPLAFYDLVRYEVSFDSDLLPDPVIIRSNGMPAYNFSVVIDDHLMNIDLVVRGEDHISNTARQLALYDALGFKRPKFAHLSMVMGEDNTKLSKRHGSTSINQFREAGYLPQALFNYLALLGWSPGNDSVVLQQEELIKRFNLKKVSKSAAIFDYQKLKWLNREHIRLIDDDTLAGLMVPFLHRAGFQFEENAETMDWIGKAARALSNYHYLLSDIAEAFKQFTSLDCDPGVIEDLKNSETAARVVAVLSEEIGKIDSPVEFSQVGEIAKQIQAREGIKGKALFHPMRLALTGRESGMELKDFIPLIETGALLGFTPGVLNMAARLRCVTGMG